MHKIFDQVECLFPESFELDEFILGNPYEPFSEEVVLFLDDLSKILVKDKRSHEFPDVATFAFFCRKSNILSIKKKYVDAGHIRLGRGIVFHITPSNVPVNFAYSFLAGILAGNLNIIRVPSIRFTQVMIIIEAIKKVCERKCHEELSRKLILVRYDRQNTFTSECSSFCDVRIIWGGDTTINQIRENKLPSRAFDVTFADRYSLCAINADSFI